MTATPALKTALFAAATLAVAVGAQGAVAQSPAAASRPVQIIVRSSELPDSDLRSVLDAQVALGLKPIETLSPAEARRQPTLAQAMARVLKAQGRSPGPDATVSTKDFTYGPDPAEVARVYTPVNMPKKPRPPLVIYYPDGGWVTGDLDEFDATPRLLAAQLNAVVVALEYRHAPEHTFLSQHADAAFGYDWAVKKGGEAGADRGKILVAGEGAGGNLAVYAAMRAFEADGKAKPKVVLAIDPVATGGRATPSKALYADARPLNTAMLGWYARQAARTPEDLNNPKWDLTTADLRVLPHVVIVNAEIDPLRDDGAALEQALKAVGVKADRQVFHNMTHGFFGLSALVRGSYDANQWALAAVRPDLDIHDAEYHGGFGTLGSKKPAGK